MPDLIRIGVDCGKYTVIQRKDGGLDILRYGKPWQEGVRQNAKVILALTYDLEKSRILLDQVHRAVGCQFAPKVENEA